MYVVGVWNASADYGVSIRQSSGKGFSFRTEGSSLVTWRVHATDVCKEAASSAGAWHYYGGLTGGGNDHEMRMDGASVDTDTTVVTADAAVDASVGSLAGTSSPLDGSIAEVIIYNRKITTAERDDLEGYLADRYGL
jgi:hypothetical protein